MTVRAVVAAALVVVVASALLASYLASTGAMAPDGCANTIVVTEPSPDGIHKAILFERNCGATTGFSSQVSILESSDELPDDEGGNVLIISGGMTAASWGGPFVKIAWNSADKLHVTYDDAAQVHLRSKQVEGVVVTFLPD